MPFNGAGVFTRLYNWVNDASAGIDILPGRMDGDANDIAAALSNCVTRSGQSPATANLPMGGFKLTGLAAAINAGDGVNLGQLAGSGAGVGADLLGYIASGANAIQRTTQNKLRETVNIDDFQNAAGNAPGTGGDDTQSLMSAILSTVMNGGFGIVELSAGKVYNIASTFTLDGALGLTIRGKNGGNVGNLSAGSSGGASTLNFTNTTGDGLKFTGVAYAAKGIRLEDLMLVGNTSGTVLTYDNCSEITYRRVIVTNAGGTTPSTGNGVHYSNCFYVDGSGLRVWKSGALYTVGQGITIDKGALSAFLGGLYNFTDSTSCYGFASGYVIGDPTPGATSYQNYASINIIGSELNGCSIGITVLYGAKAVNILGNYIEGCLSAGVVIENQARSVTVRGNFFNNSTAGSADVLLGQNGSGTSYTQFYDVDISYNHFLAVNKFGILTAASGQGSSFNAEGNEFTLATAGAIAISSSQAAVGNLRATARNNSFYGFAVGTSMAGYYTTQNDNHEYSAAGAFLGSWKQANLLLPAFVTFTQIQPNDPDTTTITNTTAGARYINATPAASKNRRQFVTLTAASTQNVTLYKSDAVTSLAVLTPGKAAWMWNDGTNEYASLLP